MRHGSILRAPWPIAVAALVAACGFDPHPKSGAVACKPQGTACCPEGYICVGLGTSVDGGVSQGTCWYKEDLPLAALVLTHDYTSAIPNDPACLVTDWLPTSGTGGAGGLLDGGAVDAGQPSPTGAGGAGGFDAEADVPFGQDYLDVASERLLPPPLDGAADAPIPPNDGGAYETLSLDGAAVDPVGEEAAGMLDASVDLSTGGEAGLDGGAETGKWIASIAASREHACAVVNGGVLCWGDYTYGVLGNNSTTITRIPTPVIGLQSGATAVATAYGHSCAVVNGGVKCWGYNVKGQLGNNSTFDSPVPVSVVGLESGATAIAARDNTTCVLVDGGVKCWGENYAGQLGDGTQQDSLVPVQVAGLTSGVTAIATGGGYGCALVDGGLLCWGGNALGTLGDGTSTMRTTPVQVIGLETGVTAVAAGSDHACAVLNGGVRCWGYASGGRLGDGTTAAVSKPPVQVVGITAEATAVTISNGGPTAHSCALVAGAVQCWGSNNDAQLGGGPGADSSIPVQVVGLAGAALVTAGGGHTCALVGQEIECWGFNDACQAGGAEDVQFVLVPSVVSFL